MIMGVPVVTLAAPKEKPLHAWNVGKGMNTVAGLADLIAHSEDEVGALMFACVCVPTPAYTDVCVAKGCQRHPKTMRMCV